MTNILCLIFFFSGASALIFEILWFQLAGLVFGNSVWAASIVLSSFMGGLALGNGLVAFKADKVRFPIRIYAYLEIVTALSGFTLVLILPELTTLFAPLFRIFLEHGFILNTLRGIIAFSLLLFPTTAMGATLPILVKALYSEDPNFGKVLGKLYGWNTLGAVFGIIACDSLFVKFWGIRGTGLVAACLNLFSSLTAIWISKQIIKTKGVYGEKTEIKSIISKTSSKCVRFLLASFISGFAILALEVIWFRFIILFFNPNRWNFGVMVGVVLLGISFGGFIASKWFQFRSKAHIFISYALFLNVILIIISYKNFAFTIDRRIGIENLDIFFVSIYLIFPVSLISGIVFTMLGNALHAEMKAEIEVAGLLTLANTIGAMLGSFIAGFLFIPYFGVEISFFVIAIAYLGTGFLVFDREKISQSKTLVAFFYLIPIISMLSIFLFPFGLMKSNFLDIPCVPFKTEKRVAVLEGITETIQYLRRDIMGEPLCYRLVTNSYSMSGTQLNSKRYMKSFVYLPIALNPESKSALLICFGCGMTAKALTDTSALERIEIVDISKDILEMSSNIVFSRSEDNPLNDPRVKIHIEDGRFFLLTTKHKYDLITAEPPPPGHKGIVNLYTQEYFQLIYNCLSDGGIVTYWLPVHQLYLSETKSILKGFCNVFNCTSVWTGAGYDWVIVGIKNPQRQISDVEFSRQWNDPVVGPEMGALGLLSPEQFGSLFIADGDRLKNWISDGLPLVDNYPYRLSDITTSGKYKDIDLYKNFADNESSRSNFMKSELIHKIWPDSYRKSAEKYFAARETIDNMLTSLVTVRTAHVVNLHNCIHNHFLRNYIPWAFNINQYLKDIIINVLKHKSEKEVAIEYPEVYYTYMAAEATQHGDYVLAEQYLSLSNLSDFQTYSYRIYLLSLSGNRYQASFLVDEYINLRNEGQDSREKQILEYLNWLVKTFK